jgi:hypothetical protein
MARRSGAKPMRQGRQSLIASECMAELGQSASSAQPAPLRISITSRARAGDCFRCYRIEAQTGRAEIAASAASGKPCFTAAWSTKFLELTRRWVGRRPVCPCLPYPVQRPNGRWGIAAQQRPPQPWRRCRSAARRLDSSAARQFDSSTVRQFDSSKARQFDSSTAWEFGSLGVWLSQGAGPQSTPLLAQAGAGQAGRSNRSAYQLPRPPAGNLSWRWAPVGSRSEDANRGSKRQAQRSSLVSMP